MKNKNKHSNNCRYREYDKMAYAYMQLPNDKGFIIAAAELELYDEYLDYARNKDKAICIDYNQADNELYQIAYGGIMFDTKRIPLVEVLELADKMKGYAFIDLEKEGKVNVSGYMDIVLYPEHAVSENFIPFAALIQTSHRLDNVPAPLTMFPALSNYKYVWENMVNRPFLMACKKTCMIDNLSVENWKEFIDERLMMDVYKTADLVF